MALLLWRIYKRFSAGASIVTFMNENEGGILIYMLNYSRN